MSGAISVDIEPRPTFRRWIKSERKDIFCQDFPFGHFCGEEASQAMSGARSVSEATVWRTDHAVTALVRGFSRLGVLRIRK